MRLINKPILKIKFQLKKIIKAKYSSLSSFCSCLFRLIHISSEGLYCIDLQLL